MKLYLFMRISSDIQFAAYTFAGSSEFSRFLIHLTGKSNSLGSPEKGYRGEYLPMPWQEATGAGETG